MKLSVGICQLEVTSDKQFNLQKALAMIKDAASQGAQLVVLPEMFTCPYNLEAFEPFSESISDGNTVKMLAEAAREYRVYIVGGSIPEKDKDKLYNTCPVFDKQGMLIGQHRKIHLFDINLENKISFQESAVLSPGNSITVLETPFAKIGIAICYDIRFPELFRAMTMQGAEIFFVPAAFNMTTGPLHWETLFRSRAIDNQVFMLAASPARNLNSSYIVYGHSCAINPWGKIIKEANGEEQLLMVNIDLTEIKEMRKSIPVWKHRREDLYKLTF